ncbi:MAG: GNAT family N-acetyltransferase [Chloroflexi bacterium]|nr:GNAT family N-acetyltransferase [Chloroflexota bacterium]
MIEATGAAAGVPYPLGHGQVGVTTRHNQCVCIRHIVKRDAELLVDLFHNLSERTKWLRFFSPVGIPAHKLWDEATRLSDIDPRIQAALIATIQRDDREQPVAVARMIRSTPLSDTAEVAIVVRDDFQREGIGRTIFDLLVQVALVQGIKQLYAITLPENQGMQRLARGVGLPVSVRVQAGEMTITIYLQDPAAKDERRWE